MDENHYSAGNGNSGSTDVSTTCIMEPRANRKSVELDRPISYIHQTADGPVHLLVRASRMGWDSIHWGRKLAGAWTFPTMVEANRYVLHRFRRLYYGHRCSGACGPVDSLVPHKYDDPWGLIRESGGNDQLSGR